MTQVSVIIPAFNEEDRLPVTLGQVFAFLEAQPFPSEVVVVDDGSTDRTRSVAQEVMSEAVPCRVIVRETNGGKGAASRHGILAATGDLVLLMDADNSAKITELPKLLRYATDMTSVVIGSRYAAGACIEVRQPLHRVLVSRVGNQLIQRTVLPGLKDTQCGFKLLPRGPATMIAKKLTRDRFSFDIEMLVVAASLGLKIVERPINWTNHPDTKLRVFRSSVELLRDLAWIRSHYGTPAGRPREEECLLPGKTLDMSSSSSA